MSQYQVLTDENVVSFLDNGYLIVKDCLDLGLAQRWIAEAYDRLGYDPGDPGTWAKDIVWMDHKNYLPVREAAPKAWAAILDVVGGEQRLETQLPGFGEIFRKKGQSQHWACKRRHQPTIQSMISGVS